MRQKPVLLTYPHSQFARGIEDIANHLCDNGEENTQSKLGIAQLFTNLLRSRIRK
jgi:Flp pilus assembly CpaE family ATPase